MDDDTYFEAQIENLKRELKVNPNFVYGEDAKTAAKKYGYLGRGAYLWEEEENLIALANKSSISTLAHEMRHSWQHDYSDSGFKYEKPKSKNLFIKKIKRFTYLLNYSLNRKEKDADKFALDYVSKMGITGEIQQMRKRIFQNIVSSVLIIIGYVLLVSLMVIVIYVFLY